MILKEAEYLALDLLIKHQLNMKGWRFKFDRAKNRMGLCRYGHKCISLSRVLTFKASEKEVEDTLLHEIAHALVGPGFGHGKVWKQMARKIGCSAERCHNVKITYKYILRCEKCGKVTGKRNRRKNLVHISCGGRILYFPYIPDSEENVLTK